MGDLLTLYLLRLELGEEQPRRKHELLNRQCVATLPPIKADSNTMHAKCLAITVLRGSYRHYRTTRKFAVRTAHLVYCCAYVRCCVRSEPLQTELRDVYSNFPRDFLVRNGMHIPSQSFRYCFGGYFSLAEPFGRTVYNAFGDCLGANMFVADIR